MERNIETFIGCDADYEDALSDIEQRTEIILADQKLPLLIGGEHLVTLGAVRAVAKHAPDVHIIHFDAHTDLREDYLGAKLSHAYRLAGPTCLAGDVIGDYSFQNALSTGALLFFGDMAIYTTCKNNTFNGMPLPDIYMRDGDGTLTPLTHFQYENFKKRLGRESR